jgi:chemotaxis protein methyltransferase CheR
VSHDLNILGFFARYIEAELGIVYAEHNYFQLQNRLEEIAKLLGIDSVEKLYATAQTGIQGQFKQLLLDLATNNETSFFRDIKVFKTIEELVLPAFVKNPGYENTEFRIPYLVSRQFHRTRGALADDAH